MLSDALNYPMKGDNGIVRILIGGLLSALGSIFVLPAIPLLGYFIKVGADSSNGIDTPAEFEDWGDLFVKGLIGAVISLVYSFVPFLIGGVFFFAAFVVMGIGGSADSGAVAGIGLLGLFVAFLLAMVVGMLVVYIVPAALIAYGRSGSIGAAFDIGEMGEVLLSGDYLAAAIMPILVFVAVFVVNSILFATFIGILLVPFVQFYATAIIFRMFGTAYAKVKGTSGTAAAETPTTTV